MRFPTQGRFLTAQNAPKREEKPLPPVSTMAKNAARAIGRNVAALVAGKKLNAQEGMQEARLNVCRQCEFFRASDERCSHKNCGCRLRLKTWLRAERCPAAKW